MYNSLLILVSSGMRPTIPQLSAFKKPEGEMLRIMEIICSHSMVTCVQFAHVLLNDRLLVEKMEKNKKSKDEFIHAVLSKWVSSPEGPSDTCTWPDLLKCMRKAGMDGDHINQIRDVVMPAGISTDK